MSASASASSNPLLDTDWDADPLALPPFAAIEPRHFAPAFAAAMQAHRTELDRIAANPAAPDFDNSVAAIDRSGALLARIDKVFWNLVASASTPALQAAQRELAPQLAAHDSAMYLDPRLFARLDALHARRAALALADDERRLLERLHADFVFAGARLQGAARARCGAIAEQLAALTTRFSQNVLADENAFALELPDEAALAGLPPTLRAACARAAADRGRTGHVVTLSRSLIEPFLAHSARRDLREQAWRAWVARGEPANAEVARHIVALRRELAALHGHASYADFTLTDTMAGTRGAVQALLDQVWAPALAAAQREREAIEGAMAAAGARHTLEPWDWRHYAEQVRRARYDVDDAEVKPYFALERVVQAAFDCAGRLFGIRFVARPDLRAWHDDVQAYEVRDVDGGALRALFLHDNFARPGKRSGAWMSQLRLQHRDGAPAIPVVVNNNNFAKGEPTLLSFDDARTLFHEFGHGLHGMLSDVRWRRLSGTQVLRDFVELPSQLFEHWIEERDVLQRHARHHVTGAPIPPALIDRVERARRFGSGYATVSYAASALLDLHLHARTDAVDDIVAFERERLAALEAPPAIGPRHRLLHFDHLFAGDAYASKYYVYLWAEVLDADAFDAFVEAGDAFDTATAQRLRDTIYAAGAARDPKEAYRAFRGRDATVEPMLKGRGLLTTD